MEKAYRMKNLDCGSCASKIERAIRKMDGVEDANVNFMTQRLLVTAPVARHESLLTEMRQVAHKIEAGTEIL